MKIKILSGKEKDIPSNIFDSALKLRYKIYLEEGFIQENKEEKDYDDYDKEATHFIALDEDKENQVVGYLRLLEKMPLSSIFGEEVEKIKHKNNYTRPVELSRFVIEKNYRINRKIIENYEDFVSFLLFKEVYKTLLSSGVDSIFIAVHPRYESRYKKYYNFKRYGEKKNYPLVKNNQAILLYNDIKKSLESLEKKNKKVYEFMEK